MKTFSPFSSFIRLLSFTCSFRMLEIPQWFRPNHFFFLIFFPGRPKYRLTDFIGFSIIHLFLFFYFSIKNSLPYPVVKKSKDIFCHIFFCSPFTCYFVSVYVRASKCFPSIHVCQIYISHILTSSISEMI